MIVQRIPAMTRRSDPADPHAGGPVLAAGAPLATARAALIMVHGRGATAASMLELADELEGLGVAYLAPQATGQTWYPHSFLAPIPGNEPYLSSALGAVAAVLARVGAAGIPPARTILLGFSQGACLVLEFAARYAQRYGGLAGLSGGLIGPDGTSRTYPGTFAGTPVFLGCSDVDFHIPKARVEETAAVLTRLGATVTLRLYPNMGHTVNADEVAAVNGLIADVVHRET